MNKLGESLMHNQISIIYTTCASKQDAERLAEQAVLDKYAACVNIIPGATSVYEWDGKIEKDQEYLLLFKTDVTRVNDLYAWLQDNHPYEVPAILQGDANTSENFYEYIRTHSTDISDSI